MNTDAERGADDLRAEWARLYANEPEGVIATLRAKWPSILGAALKPVEAALGEHVTPDHSRVVTTNELTEALLTELFVEHRICALRVPKYCSVEAAERISTWMLETFGCTKWALGETDPDMFHSAGIPYIAAMKSPDLYVKYFLRSRVFGSENPGDSAGLPPLDRLRLELAELWSPGVTIAKIHGRTMVPNVGRVMTPGGLIAVSDTTKTQGVCHLDASPYLKPDYGMFTANVYLRVPETGGELLVWNVRFHRRDFARNFALIRLMLDYVPEAQEFLQSRLPPPIVIKPEVGDLIFINPGRPHSVRGFSEGFRVTNQSFIRYREDEPLEMFS